MNAWTLSAAWLASCAPLALEAAGHPLASPGAHARLALALLPWIALAGLPRTRASESRLRDALLPLAAALPLACAAFALDRAQGLGSLPLALFAANALALLLLLALAASLAASSRAWPYELAWLVLVPGTALLHGALSWGARDPRSAPPAWLGLLARSSPLGWCHGAIEGLAAEPDRAPGAVALGALAVAFGLLAAAKLSEGRAP